MEYIYLEAAEVEIDTGQNANPPTVVLVLIGKDHLATSLKLEGDVIYQLVELFQNTASRLPPRKAAH